MLEIEKLAKMSRDLAKVNQELEESRMLAVSDRTRTEKRLLLVSGQLEYTELKLFNLTKERDDGQKDSDLLRIERIKREALQEREDAGILKIEALQDELQDCQRSERLVQQKLITIQSKYETLTKRHDNLKRQQQELELARESKEALAWLKETTDRLCSPPKGSLGQAIQQERSSYGSAANELHQTSPSSSPPYPSSFIDPPLAAQNQLISLIKELATTNSTLRSELNEYRDLLQDTRNEVLTLRTQVEDYEQGHAFECCASRQDDTESFLTSKSAWSAMDIPFGGGLDAVSHIGTLGSIPGSPPPFMNSTSKHRHHHRRHSGVRGNVFGELERLYSQGSQVPSSGKHKRSHSSKRSRRGESREEERAVASSAPSESNPTTMTVSTSTSTSEIRRGSTPLPLMSSSRSPPNPTPSKLRQQYGTEGASPASNTSRSRRSMYTDADLDMLESGSDSDDGDISSDAAETEDEQGPGFVAAFAEVTQSRTSESRPISPIRHELALLPPASLADELMKTGAVAISTPMTTTDTVHINSMEAVESSPESHLKTRTSSISLLSAELHKATRDEAKRDLFMEGDRELAHNGENEMHPLEGRRSTSFTRLEHEAIVEDQVHIPLTSSTWDKPEYGRFTQHEKSSSDQGVFNTRQRRRLSEPLHQIAGVNSIPTKRSRPGSIYSIRRPRHRLESSDGYCSHLGHAATGSVGCLPELQRHKNTELVEPMVTERRQRMMEVWRVGVIEAAVTQQQSIHAVVAFGEQRKDGDSISIRSKASQRRVKGVTGKQTPGNPDDRADDAADPAILVPSSHISESTIKDHRKSQDTAGDVDTDVLGVAAVFPAVAESSTSNLIYQDMTHLTVDAATGSTLAFEARKLPKDVELTREQKRRSVRSVKSFRSSFLHSPMGRSPLMARERRFPSETSTASEAFSNRRHDQEHRPYQLLHTLSTELLERLARSDTREMNRRLRRTFDIQALSQMSNSVIENVLTDVSNLGERFRWVEAQVANPVDELLDRHLGMHTPVNGEGSAASGQEDEGEADGEEVEDDIELSDWGFSVDEFFPLAHVVQEMLSEIGKLRMTINELQLSYVLKVEQDRIKAEKDFMEEFESEDETDFDYQHHQHHHHHHHHHHHLEEPVLTKSEQAADKPGQLKNVLGGMLERPRMLGSASTGVSGFFNKVFGGSDKPSQDDAKPVDTGKSPAVPQEPPKDKPTMSKSKSGLVIAETSRVFAESAWISSPNKAAEAKTAPKGAPVADGTRISSSGGIVLPNSRLSATTSLSTMATLSPAPSRSNTIHVSEGAANTTAASTVMIRALDIRFSPNTKRINMPHSPPATSPVAESSKSLFSRSLPQTQPFGMLSSETDPAFVAPVAQGISTGSFKSMSSLPEESGAGPDTVFVSTPESERVHVDVLTRSSDPVAVSSSSSANKAPRPLGLSTKTSGLALNVVTKQDVFQDHWVTSTSSSLSMSASGSMVNSDKRSNAESIIEGIPASQPYRNSSSAASLSSNSTTHEATASLTPRLGAKPTLITRSGLTAVTPSTSTVSSPVSATSWFDAKRFSGGASSTEATRPTSDANPPQENIFTAGFFSAGSGFGSGSGSGSASTALANTDQVFRKTRAVTSFHGGPRSRGSMDSVTRSLGRASGRESALAFLRGEVPASTVLSSLFNSSDTPLEESSSLSSDPVATIQSGSKGKGLASERGLTITQANVEVLDTDAQEKKAEQEQEQEQRGRSRETLGIQGYITRAAPTITPSHSENGLLVQHAGAMSTPTTSLSQRAAVTSTAVAYVVATPDHAEDRDSSRKKRAVFDRDLIKASQKRILASVQHQQAVTGTDRPFVPQSNPRKARALSVDSAQSTEPLPANERLDLWRVGAGVSRDIWRGFIKKVDGGRSGGGGGGGGGDS
ncbi:hypothetical protein BGZ96_010418 [Linnemannia gamsii]|uniref:Uncharacterized protein n=1 Tax=Linnemannia gamsii TaxID=64522 RepID=A0ABQ7KDM6_9FUNG|nr:hypothetical protein BGZ96_010418 [Linnemannia gamsii]